jgi:hypothetical protein
VAIGIEVKKMTIPQHTNFSPDDVEDSACPSIQEILGKAYKYLGLAAAEGAKGQRSIQMAREFVRAAIREEEA